MSATQQPERRAPLLTVTADEWLTITAFYEVDRKTVEKLVERNRSELGSDGYRLLEGEELMSLKDISSVGRRARALAVLPRRAVLRVGMLLRDSAVARAVRDHLLNAERPAAMPTHPEALRGWADALDRTEAAEQRAAELEPDAARARRTMDADGLALVGTVAKRFGITEKALRQFLYAEGLLIRGGERHNEPMARYVQSGHFELKIRLVGDHLLERNTTFVTPKGEALIWKRLYDAGYVRSPQAPPVQLQLSP
ncbi:phage antirepressor KilAC domain-containing protein [Crossiella sp. CA198]|uniref:phage antirepressor KilAC domain-containing protein n=1 Tax=Crossiella sp. CA198 TaxID=3455607 RepID=UPI003F8D8D84